MHRTLLAALALAATAVPALPAAADPTAFSLEVDAQIHCFGCGVSSGTLDGDVLAGLAGFRGGATITGAFSHDGPAGATCLMTSTMSGAMTTSDGYATTFNLTRLGGDVVATFDDGSTATGTFAVVSPVGNPCGGPVTARITLAGGGNGAPAAPPGAFGHVTIHRFPGTGPMLLAAPVTENGAAWTCVDVRSGAPVQQFDVLATPDPGVECQPPAGSGLDCSRLVAGGYIAPFGGAGSIAVTATCGGASVTRAIGFGSAGFGTAPVTSSLPLRCEVQESLNAPATTDYWTFCQVNSPF